MKLNRFFHCIVLCLISHVAVSQQAFQYKRKVEGVAQKQWHTVTLPADIFQHTSNDFSDLRFFTISNSDTLEIPYVLNVRETQSSQEEVDLKVMNESRKNDLYFLTLVNSSQKLNSILLNFKEDNFFATVKIEGSENKKDWLELASNENIFSVENDRESYKYTTLSFPTTDYPFLKLTIKSSSALHYTSAQFVNESITPGIAEEVKSDFTTLNDKKNKQSVINIKLNEYRPVNYLKLNFDTENNFYRSARVEVLNDSIKTEKGWVKNYVDVSGWFVTSFRPNVLEFSYRFTKEIRVTIYNNDNQPLTVKDATVSGPSVQLTAEFAPADNYLFYGNSSISSPTYDLEHFKDKIPANPASASLGTEETLIAPKSPVAGIFENKLWLWGIMAIVIGVLGFFTMRMMGSKNANA